MDVENPLQSPVQETLVMLDKDALHHCLWLPGGPEHPFMGQQMLLLWKFFASFIAFLFAQVTQNS